jgi:hypothetical protein
MIQRINILVSIQVEMLKCNVNGVMKHLEVAPENTGAQKTL